MLFEELTASAKSLGASDAAIIGASEIPVEDHLADFCRKNPGCENYGLSMSCPPHVSGPAGFRKLQRDFSHGLVFSFTVPVEVLLAEPRPEIFQQLHETGACIEALAKKIGFSDARAFAGGSCRRIFCRDQPDCRALKRGEKCRYPDSARPSMSGFGIDVSALMKMAGISMEWMGQPGEENGMKMGTVCGLVLICSDS